GVFLAVSLPGCCDMVGFFYETTFLFSRASICRRARLKLLDVWQFGHTKLSFFGYGIFPGSNGAFLSRSAWISNLLLHFGHSKLKNAFDGSFFDCCTGTSGARNRII